VWPILRLLRQMDGKGKEAALCGIYLNFEFARQGKEQFGCFSVLFG
jgi:hypothetical protein